MDTKNQSPKIDNNKEKLVNKPLLDLKQVNASDLNQNMMIRFTKNYEELQKKEIKNFLVNEFGSKITFSETFVNSVLDKVNESI